MNFTQNLGIPRAHKISKYLQYVCHFTHSCKWLSLLGTIEMQSPHVFWRMYTWKSKAVIIKSIKHDILSVSKSVAWYQQYVHITACLSTGYIQTVWRQVKVTFIPVPGKVNYTQSKAYCAISLLSFMQKIMEKLVTKNINNKTLGHVPYIYNNLPTKQRCPQKSQCIMWIHTYREQQETGSHTWAYIDIGAASNSTTCDTTNAVNGMGLETHSSNGLVPPWVTEKSPPHLNEKHWKDMWPSAIHRGAFYCPKAVKPCCCRTHRGPQERLSYTKVCATLITWKYPNSASQLVQEALSKERQWCGKTQLPIHLQKVQQLINILWNQVT